MQRIRQVGDTIHVWGEFRPLLPRSRKDQRRTGDVDFAAGLLAVGTVDEQERVPTQRVVNDAIVFTTPVAA